MSKRSGSDRAGLKAMHAHYGPPIGQGVAADAKLIHRADAAISQKIWRDH